VREAGETLEGAGEFFCSYCSFGGCPRVVNQRINAFLIRLDLNTKDECSVMQTFMLPYQQRRTQHQRDKPAHAVPAVVMPEHAA
jgi:hypothetical protein